MARRLPALTAARRSRLAFRPSIPSSPAKCLLPAPGHYFTGGVAGSRFSAQSARLGPALGTTVWERWAAWNAEC